MGTAKYHLMDQLFQWVTKHVQTTPIRFPQWKIIRKLSLKIVEEPMT